MLPGVRLGKLGKTIIKEMICVCVLCVCVSSKLCGVLKLFLKLFRWLVFLVRFLVFLLGFRLYGQVMRHHVLTLATFTVRTACNLVPIAIAVLFKAHCIFAFAMAVELEFIKCFWFSIRHCKNRCLPRRFIRLVVAFRALTRCVTVSPPGKARAVELEAFAPSTLARLR
mmetsp:Transcript_7470/g.13536  ORF Transcript_7470/g.13536 Transcript_7470/m.13536 type:complete len:169 (-) Transcript_7470:2336-2842(-)